MNVKQVLTYAVIAFAIWWVIEQPANAGHLIHNIASFLTTAANGLAHFVSDI